MHPDEGRLHAAIHVVHTINKGVIEASRDLTVTYTTLQGPLKAAKKAEQEHFREKNSLCNSQFRQSSRYSPHLWFLTQIVCYILIFPNIGSNFQYAHLIEISASNDDGLTGYVLFGKNISSFCSILLILAGVCPPPDTSLCEWNASFFIVFKYFSSTFVHNTVASKRYKMLNMTPKYLQEKFLSWDKYLLC